MDHVKVFKNKDKFSPSHRIVALQVILKLNIPLDLELFSQRGPENTIAESNELYELIHVILIRLHMACEWPRYELSLYKVTIDYNHGTYNLLDELLPLTENLKSVVIHAKHM